MCYFLCLFLAVLLSLSVLLTLLLRPLCWDSNWFCGFVGVLSSEKVKQNSGGKVRTRTTHLVVDRWSNSHTQQKALWLPRFYVSLFLHVHVIGRFLITILGTPFREDLIFHMLRCSIQLRDDLSFAFPAFTLSLREKTIVYYESKRPLPKPLPKPAHWKVSCAIHFSDSSLFRGHCRGSAHVLPLSFQKTSTKLAHLNVLSHTYLPILPTHSVG